MSEPFLFLAQAPPAASAPAWLQFVPMLLILVVFYFLLVAPMRKKQRELQGMIDKLQKGDRVVTNGGLHGEVAGIEGSIVLLKIADNVKVKVSKSAVAQVEERSSGA
jgi:preprotein translocase subunit YajC